jgi:hypothetical protein
MQYLGDLHLSINVKKQDASVAPSTGTAVTVNVKKSKAEVKIER